MKKTYMSPKFSKTMFVSLDNISMEDEQSIGISGGESVSISSFNAAPSFSIFENNILGVIFDDPKYSDCSCKECFSDEMCVRECSDGC